MTYLKFCLGAGCLLLSSPALAMSEGQGWFVRAGAGLGEPDFHSTMTVNNGSGFPAPLNNDVYSTRKKTATTVNLAAGYRWARQQTWLPVLSAGLTYQHLFSNEINGTITQYSLPQFANYRYTWAVESEVLAIFARANLRQYQRFLPYLDGSIGSAWNTASHYRETAFSGVTPRISPMFRHHTATDFTYSLGAGIDVVLTDKIMLSFGYEFRDWGTLTSKSGELTWSQEQLNAGHYRTHSGLITVTYLFGQSTAPLLK
ncbi:hypothetical protein DIZ81_06785 [Legionella taurinensis]|uniref:Outer membrane protein beta-barrel domain-containing protein n=1 Tax=Legionella taurinensis TaxID=70611 RepID=A0AB38N7U8_9GAMM|nr:outer membrane beta-barrel protein [Legionella taurinensis]MDX1837223.1 outer membrane beta-barrel protein [Legionella taurinensis]PUT40304.1 hypothetical protein DB744_06785 [Legionella taurinensis]PUT41538.1 hypothetical protein DB746_09295 [Legionella taurinensis]PUT44404.1 hypothetical protein DB743_08510 [Legionella taurinensis]PUT48366.1 hypothetical protein DB745_05185 [Legionella taurinensis]